MVALDWAAAKARHALCALHGHSMMLKTEPGRLYLRCLTCGAKTAGWEIGHCGPVDQANRRQRPAHATIANSTGGGAHGRVLKPVIAATTAGNSAV
jgi:hypothetical protein